MMIMRLLEFLSDVSGGYNIYELGGKGLHVYVPGVGS
jgi:hypothetical protein